MFNPSSKVRLYKNVPLDLSNTNQLWFDSISEQNTYFASVPVINANITDSEYVEDSWIFYVDINREKLRDVNYIAYQNIAYGNKWIYAFVTEIKYENPNLSSIKFTIDDFQTYLFNLKFRPCYVEREHVSDDSIGANIIDENIGYGDYVVNNRIKDTVTGSYNYVVASTRSITDPILDNLGGGIYNGVFSGIKLYGYDNYNSLKTALQNFQNYSDSIYSIYMAPKFISSFNSGSHLIEETLSQQSENFGNISRPNSVDGYVPKNKKLLTYPYLFLALSNNGGNENILRYEFFKNPSLIQFVVEGVLNNGVQCMCYPEDYKGLGINREYQLTLPSNPNCLYVNDVYSTWLTQNTGSILSQVGGATGMVAIGALTQNPVLTASGVAYTSNILANMTRMTQIPDEVRGSQGGNYIMAGSTDNSFIVYQKSITKEYARVIDDFFTRYGYKVNRLKLPNFHSRQNWNFIKTSEFNVIGECPSTSIANIKSMFNNGVTLWHTSDVGNYNLSNNII